MGLFHTVSEIVGDFSRKLQKKNSHPRVFCAPADGVPLGIGYRRRGQKNRNDGATRWSKKFQDGLDTEPACDIQPSNHVATAVVALCYTLREQKR